MQRTRVPWLAAVVLAVAVLAGTALLSTAARSGPYTTHRPVIEAGEHTLTPPTTAFTPPAGGPTRTQPAGVGGTEALKVLGRVLGALLLVAGLGLVAMVLRWAARQVAGASGRRTPPTARNGQRSMPDAFAASVEQALHQVDQPDAREAVVRAWLLLGAAAAEAGSPARESETATEYADRIATEQRLPQPELYRLAELYREARFSDHPVTEGQRGEARDVLHRLQALLHEVPA